MTVSLSMFKYCHNHYYLTTVAIAIQKGLTLIPPLFSEIP
ncbi:hypothetical protein SPLC1_S511000 [Arthrospira platensis C1]|nr:hypothetical protein SPLC1_S511000 [Arthrospira platensis C1]